MKNRIVRFLICLIPVGLMALLPVKAVWSADEDIDPSVYLVFDPATGEFTTVDEAESNQSSVAATKANPSEQGAGSPETAASTPATDSRQSSSTSSDGENGLSPVWIGSAVTLLLLGGVVFFTRKNQHKLSS